MDEKRLSELEKEESELIERLQKVRIEKSGLVSNDFFKHVDRNQIYRINYWLERDYEESPFIGFITDCHRFRSNSDTYTLNLCYFTNCDSDYEDEAYSTFVAFTQRDIREENLQEFIDSLEPISDEEFNSCLSEWLVESEKNIKNWFNYFKNKNYENEEE